MHSYLIINHTCSTFEIGFFIDNQLQDQSSQDKRLASKLLIPMIEHIVSRNNTTFEHISFIGINQGPGLFSTLRSIIATANALHFATHVPLIGIDGLEATLIEFSNNEYPYNIALINAFNNEVYYAVSYNTKILSKGYAHITTFLENNTQQVLSQTIYFFGNGTQLYAADIKKKLSENAVIPNPIPQLCSLTIIARMALEKFIRNETSDSYLTPLYLKKHPVEKI